MNIPIVIIHTGNQEYLHTNLKYIKYKNQNNNIYLLGDDSNSNVISYGIQHINLNELYSQLITIFENNFVNYSTNNHNFELICFLRIFFLYNWMIKYNIEKCVHLDSDCVLVENLNNIYNDYNIAYSYQDKTQNEYHMVGSVHNSFLTKEFCKKFIDLCFRIYVTKEDYKLIEPKILYHKKNNIPGGICDMTIYYLLVKHNIININNLNDIINDSTYINNINDTYGCDGNDTWLTNKYGKITIIKENELFYAIRKSTNTKIKLNTLHFQGGAKQLMNNILENGFE